MSVRKTSVAIDEDLLEDARELLGTSTVRETIHAALLEVLQNRARLEEVEALSSMDGLDLADTEVMSGAWRS
jgi:Arc/MetJ family transcription regulator